MRLPPEIIFHVLSFLSAKDLALVQLSCSALARYGTVDVTSFFLSFFQNSPLLTRSTHFENSLRRMVVEAAVRKGLHADQERSGRLLRQELAMGLPQQGGHLQGPRPDQGR